MSATVKTKGLLALSAILIALSFLAEPASQDPGYHHFADTRALFGIANFWNVISNLPFLIVGGAGLWFLRTKERQGIISGLYTAYLIFFGGVCLTSIGSSWFHLAPGNNTLLWDRLPMTIAFMALFAIVIGEHVCDKSARRLLAPLLIAGATSVLYWHYTESVGAGDLRPYAVVQFLPMILIPVILLAYPSRFSLQGTYWGMIALYALSKIFEYFDFAVFEAGSLLSGHSIKHVVAAAAPALLLYGIKNRRIQK
jgi:hypothetical protein